MSAPIHTAKSLGPCCGCRLAEQCAEPRTATLSAFVSSRSNLVDMAHDTSIQFGEAPPLFAKPPDWVEPPAAAAQPLHGHHNSHGSGRDTLEQQQEEVFQQNPMIRWVVFLQRSCDTAGRRIGPGNGIKESASKLRCA